jgi:hypothetical protein
MPAQIVEIFATGYDYNGDPVSLGTVEVYASGTSTPAYVWYDREKTLPTPTGVSSFTLDTQGRDEVYGDGIYRFVVKDADGVTLKTMDGMEYGETETTLPWVDAADYLDGNDMPDFAAAVALLGSRGGLVIDTGHNSDRSQVEGFTESAGDNVQLAAAKYIVNSQIKLGLGARLSGMGATSGTVSSNNSGTGLEAGAAIGSVIAPTSYAINQHGTQIKGMWIDGNKTINPVIGTGAGQLSAGIEVYAMCENSLVEDVIIIDCAGPGLWVGGRGTPQTFNRVSLFTNAGGGLVVDANKEPTNQVAGNNYLFTTLSGDDNDGPFITLKNGSKRTVVTLVNVKSERRTVAGSHDPVILLDNFTGTLNIMGIHAYNGLAGLANDVIRITNGSSPTINITGASCSKDDGSAGYTNWINDEVNTQAITTGIGPVVSEITFNGTGPNWSYRLTDGTSEVYLPNVGVDVLHARILGDAYPRLSISQNSLLFGDGTADPADGIDIPESGVLRLNGQLRWKAADTQTTVGAAGGASALPATPKGYAIATLEGFGEVAVPFYLKA